jgi:uroporphyrinogen decarboxylase
MYTRLIEYFSEFTRVPVVPILGYPALVKLNMTTFDAISNPERHSRVIEYIKREFKVDALLPLLDLTVEAEILGAEVSYREREAPEIKRHIRIENLKEGSLGRIRLFLEATKKIRSISEGLPVGAYVTGPFTVAGQTVGITELLKFTRMRKEETLNLINVATNVVLDYAKVLEEVVDFIVIADPSSSLLSKQQFEDFSKPFLRKLTSSVRVDVVLHICGKSNHILPSTLDIGIEGISIDQNVKLEEASSIFPSNVIIFGNYSPTKLMLEKPEEIRRNVVNMLMNVCKNKNIVSSTGCDIPSETPEENIRTFIETSKSIKRW